MKAKRTKHSSSFKARVAIEALQERESISELARKCEIHPNMINRWKKEFLKRAPDVFSKQDTDRKPDADLEKLYAKIGQLKMGKGS